MSWLSWSRQRAGSEAQWLRGGSYSVREDPAQVSPLPPRVHEHVQVRAHPQPGHVGALPAEGRQQRVGAVGVGEAVVGAVDGIARVDLGLGQAEHLLARQALGAVGGDDDVAEDLDARRGGDAALVLVVEVARDLLAEAHLDADLGGVVAHDLVHLAAVAGEHAVVVVLLEEEGLGEEEGAVVLEVVERVRVVEADLEQPAHDSAVGPPLHVQPAVGREVEDVAVVAAGGVRFDEDRVHAPEPAFDGRRQACKAGTDDDDAEVGVAHVEITGVVMVVVNDFSRPCYGLDVQLRRLL